MNVVSMYTIKAVQTGDFMVCASVAAITCFLVISAISTLRQSARNGAAVDSTRTCGDDE